MSFFLGQFATTLAETGKTEGAETFIRQLDQYKIGWTLLRKVDARNLVLGRLPQWQRAYGDDDAIIYQRLSWICFGHGCRKHRGKGGHPMSAPEFDKYAKDYEAMHQASIAFSDSEDRLSADTRSPSPLRSRLGLRRLSTLAPASAIPYRISGNTSRKHS